MTNVNLKLLQTFFLAAEMGSFRKAADETHRSPSAVSLQVRELEKQIGVSLFVRTSQCAVLTPEGRMLLEQIRRTMTDVRAALEQLSDIALSRRGLIKIACAPTLASTRLPNILAMFRLRFPSSDVEVRELSTAGALDLLRGGKAEFFIGPAMPGMTDFHFESVARDTLCACVPAAYDRGQKQLSIRDLGGVPLILLDHSATIRGIIDSVAKELGFNFHVHYEVQQAITAIALAASGLGVAIVPKAALAQANTVTFRLVPLSDLGAHRDIGIITLRGYTGQTPARQLLKLIRNNLKEIA
jgi:DNA-binding transcriptional LysR family regulator